MKFPSSARYKNIMEAVNLFFINEKITEFPINPYQIIDKNEWGLLPYSKLAERFNVSIQDVIETYQSKDGCVMLDNDNYTIAFNDAQSSEGRIRFTLMHEIGHIYLNHLIDFEETMRNRSKLTKSKYDVLEREAHAFARNTLSPTAVINQLKNSKKDKFIGFVDLMRWFRITQKAAKTRLDFLDWDATHAMIYGSSFFEQFNKYIYGVIHANHCLRCSHYFANENAKFCPVCGNKKLLKRKGTTILKYDGYTLNEHGIPADCPRCGNEEIYSGEYCKICGLMIINKCTKKEYDGYDQIGECGTIAEGNARFCYKCGEKTTYFESGLLWKWEDEQEIIKSRTEL